GGPPVVARGQLLDVTARVTAGTHVLDRCAGLRRSGREAPGRIARRYGGGRRRGGRGRGRRRRRGGRRGRRQRDERCHGEHAHEGKGRARGQPKAKGARSTVVLCVHCSLPWWARHSVVSGIVAVGPCRRGAAKTRSPGVRPNSYAALKFGELSPALRPGAVAAP